MSIGFGDMGVRDDLSTFWGPSHLEVGWEARLLKFGHEG